MIINQQCEMIEEALQATGVNKKYFGLPVPEVHLSRQVLREPEVHERDRPVELPDATKMYKSIYNCEYPVGDDARMVPILEEFSRGGQMQKKFGDRATIIGVGLMGPRKNCLEEQLDRTRLLKVNLANNVFYSTCKISGLRDPNKPIILKLENGEFFTPGNRTTTVQELFRNMRVDGDSLNGGEERPPFAAVIPICSGRNEGSSTLVFFDDGKGELTSKGDKIHETAGPISMTIHIMENKNSAYFLYQKGRG